MNWEMTLAQRQAHCRLMNLYRATNRITTHNDIDRTIRRSKPKKEKIEIPVYLSEHRKRFEG